MVSASLQTAGSEELVREGKVAPEPEKLYAMRKQLEIFPLDSSSRQPKFVARMGDDRSYVLPEKLKNLLLLFDGTRTLQDVARAFSASEGVEVSGEQVRVKAFGLFKTYNLIEEVSPKGQGQAGVSPEKKRDSFELVFRLPVITAQRARPVTERLMWLFHPAAVVPAVLLILLTQFVFLGRFFTPLFEVPLGATDLLIYYVLVVATAAFHEFGHAAACRRYGCEHGAIGVMLYMIFPAFYVNLSNAWRLSGKQRAVIDAGGIYFQLLTTIPLYLIHLLTGNPHCAVAIMSVNVMVLFSLNPVLKFDGYWLLVDLSGLVNLRARSWAVVQEVVRWSLGLGAGVPTLEEVAGRGKKLFLLVYSFLSVGLISSFILFLIIYAPDRARMVGAASHELVTGFGRGVGPEILTLVTLLVNLFFLYFIYKLARIAYKLLRGKLLKLLKQQGWRGQP
jgi:putative peptide zinc metalloprotease protein